MPVEQPLEYAPQVDEGADTDAEAEHSRCVLKLAHVQVIQLGPEAQHVLADNIRWGRVLPNLSYPVSIGGKIEVVALSAASTG